MKRLSLRLHAVASVFRAEVLKPLPSSDLTIEKPNSISDLRQACPETCTAFETIRDSSEARDCAREEQTIEFNTGKLEAPPGFEPGMEVLQIS